MKENITFFKKLLLIILSVGLIPLIIGLLYACGEMYLSSYYAYFNLPDLGGFFVKDVSHIIYFGFCSLFMELWDPLYILMFVGCVTFYILIFFEFLIQFRWMKWLCNKFFLYALKIFKYKKRTPDGKLFIFIKQFCRVIYVLFGVGMFFLLVLILLSSAENRGKAKARTQFMAYKKMILTNHKTKKPLYTFWLKGGAKLKDCAILIDRSEKMVLMCPSHLYIYRDSEIEKIVVKLPEANISS